MYIVKYDGGGYDDYYISTLFVTTKKTTATKYVTKFNKILKKWKKHYEQYETNEFGMKWLKDEHIDKHYDRWNSLREVTKCYWEEVEVR